MATRPILTFENYLKLGSLVVAFAIQYSAIKSDIRDLATEKRFEISHIQYVINENKVKIRALEDCCNGKENRRGAQFPERLAVQPNEIELKDDRSQN